MFEPTQILLTDNEWDIVHLARPSVKKDQLFTDREWVHLVYSLYKYLIDHPEQEEYIKSIQRKGSEIILESWDS